MSHLKRSGFPEKFIKKKLKSRLCGWCGTVGHRVETCPVLKAQKLKQIAAKLTAPRPSAMLVSDYSSALCSQQKILKNTQE